MLNTCYRVLYEPSESPRVAPAVLGERGISTQPPLEIVITLAVAGEIDGPRGSRIEGYASIYGKRGSRIKGHASIWYWGDRWPHLDVVWTFIKSPVMRPGR